MSLPTIKGSIHNATPHSTYGALDGDGKQTKVKPGDSVVVQHPDRASNGTVVENAWCGEGQTPVVEVGSDKTTCADSKDVVALPHGHTKGKYVEVKGDKKILGFDRRNGVKLPYGARLCGKDAAVYMNGPLPNRTPDDRVVCVKK